MKKKYLKKIFKVLVAVDNIWISEQVYRCAVNIAEDKKGGVCDDV